MTDPAGPRAAVQAQVDAWPPSTYTAEGYQGVRQTATYRADLHVLVEAPDGTMHRQRSCGSTKRTRRAAGATRVPVACLGAPGYPQARGLYYSVGFREFTRDAPFIKAKKVT